VDSQRDAAIDRQGENRNPEHEICFDADGVAQSIDRFVKHEKRDDGEQRGVDERRENSGAVITVGFLRGGSAFGPASGEPGNHEHGNVGEVVNRVADERHRVPGIAGNELGSYQDKCGHDGPAENEGHPFADVAGMKMNAPRRMVMTTAMSVGVHGGILPAGASRRIGPVLIDEARS